MLDMHKGKLSFMIDGELYGMSTEDEQLKQGQLIAAIALKEKDTSV